MTAHEHSHTSHHTHEHASEHRLQTLLSWHAASRPFRKKSKEYFFNILLLVFLVEVILFLFSQYLLMLVVLSFAFLAYALASVPPHDYFYKISTEGVMVDEHFFLWQELYDFYFKRTEGVNVLHVGTKAYFPGEITLVLDDMSVDHVRSILLPYLPYREYVQPTFMEKSGDWLSKTFPLEHKRS